MKTDFHTPLSAADIADINTAVRVSPPSLEIRRQIATLTGRTEDTVRRWFTSAGTIRELVPKSLNGVAPVRADLDANSEYSQRLMIGLLLTGGIKGEMSHGLPQEFDGTFAKFSEVVEHLTSIQRNRYWGWAIASYDAVPIPGGWHWVYKWREPAEGESPRTFRDLKKEINEDNDDDGDVVE